MIDKVDLTMMKAAFEGWQFDSRSLMSDVWILKCFETWIVETGDDVSKQLDTKTKKKNIDQNQFWNELIIEYHFDNNVLIKLNFKAATLNTFGRLWGLPVMYNLPK